MSENTVEWRPIAGFEEAYEVSSGGRVRSLRTGKTLSVNSLVGAGYVKVALQCDGKRLQTTMHRVVAETFLGAPDGREVNHKNGIKTDNRVENLEWVSRAENVSHAYYTLGHLVNPVIASPVVPGQELYFRSVELAVAAGFDSAHIYRCLSKPHKTHGGYYWRKAAPPAQPAERVPELKVVRPDALEIDRWRAIGWNECRNAMLDASIWFVITGTNRADTPILLFTSRALAEQYCQQNPHPDGYSIYAASPAPSPARGDGGEG